MPYWLILYCWLKRWWYNKRNIMQVDVTFSTGKVYDVVKNLDVITGSDFTLEAIDLDANARWFADKDEVLSIAIDGKSATVSALSEGSSTVLILDQQYGIIKRLEIKVVASFSQAEQLNASSSDPLLK